jgi:hypothetical protein
MKTPTHSKIPKQLYVVSMKVIEHEYDKPDYKTFTETIHNFGFLHPHEPTLKTDVKRKATQYDWAYRGNVSQNPDGSWQHEWVEYIWRNTGMGTGHQSNRVTHNEKIEEAYAPRVWENEPLSGFTIIDTVNRYRGNKLFKVLDPRGLEFEVTVASLFQIIQDGTIEKGEIKNACVWKGNKNLVIYT